MSDQKHQGWIASLSNGQTVHEHPTDKGELSAWQQLLQFCNLNNVRITQMRLQRSGITMTSVYKADGYFQAYEAKVSNVTKATTTYQGIGAVKNNFVFIVWINMQGDVFQDVRPLGEVWVHTEQRKLVDIQ